MRNLLFAGLALGTLAASISIALAQQATPPQGIQRLAPQPPSGFPPDATMAQRGDAFFQATCAACHGVQGKGGPGGSPDITLSAVAMAADGGRELREFLQAGRPDRGMPPFTLSEAEAIDLSAKLRSLGFAATPAAGGAAAAAESVVVGDATAGKAYFNGPIGQCNTCHAVVVGQASPAANLSGIATKYPNPRILQNTMILNRSFFWTPAYSKDITATVTWRDGRTVSGYLSSVSDFKVIIRDDADKEQIFPRRDGEPAVALKDRMQHHLDLLPKYRDSDIHDLTAYLVTLK
jgi:cytochrome c oxidase cbb3-type subunit III